MYDARKHQAVIYSAEDIYAAVIFVCYEDGKLSEVKIKNNQELKTGVNEIPKPEDFDDTKENVKVYVWYSLDTMVPVM